MEQGAWKTHKIVGHENELIKQANSTEVGWGKGEGRKKMAFKCVKSTSGNEISQLGSRQAHWKCINPRKSILNQEWEDKGKTCPGKDPNPVYIHISYWQGIVLRWFQRNLGKPESLLTCFYHYLK